VFFDGIDQRSSLARRFRDLVAMHSHDLSPHGPEHLTVAQQQLIRRIVSLEVQLEVMEGRMIDGDRTVDIEIFARISSHLRRMLETLGLARVKKDVTPTLGDIVAKHKAAGRPTDRDRRKAAATTQPAPEKPASEPRVEPMPAVEPVEPVNSAVIDAGHAVAMAEPA